MFVLRGRSIERERFLFYVGIVFGVLILGLVVWGGVSFFSSGEELNSGEEIMDFVLSEDGKLAYVRLSEEDLENVSSVKFIFSDSDGREYVYEVDGNVYEYNVSASDLGLENFEGIVKLKIVYEYLDDSDGDGGDLNSSSNSSNLGSGSGSGSKRKTGGGDPVVDNEPEYAMEIEQYGITWYFDKEYETGTFANGDHWVVPSEAGGNVTIVGISPESVNDEIVTADYCKYDGLVVERVFCTNFPAEYLGLYSYKDYCENNVCVYGVNANGFEVNPMPGDNHPYDIRINGFNLDLRPSLPLGINKNSSIVSTISQTSPCGECTSGGCGWVDSQGGCSLSPINVSSVLTVLEKSPPENSFRPSYVGDDKQLYSLSDVNIDLLLALDSPNEYPSIDSLLQRIKRVQLDHKEGWSGRFLHPMENMNDYGAEISRDYGDIALRLSLNDSIDGKMPLLISYIQTGIDLHGSLKNGRSWVADGGHNSGRKLPIIFSGWLLDDSEMKNIGFDYPDSTFAEDCQNYYDNDSGYPFFYGILGFPRYGERHCVYPDDEDFNAEGNPPDGHSNYMGINTGSRVGTATAVRIFGVEELWNHQSFIDYYDRYIDEGLVGSYSSQFADDMWVLYGRTMNLCNNNIRDRCSIECNSSMGVFEGETGIDDGGDCEDQIVESNTYYVDASATGANNGSVGNDAWRSFADMQSDSKYLADGLSGSTLQLKSNPNSYGEFKEGGWWSVGGMAPSPVRTDWLTINGEDGVVLNTVALGGAGRNAYLKFKDIELSFNDSITHSVDGKVITLMGIHHVYFDNVEVYGPWNDNIYGYPVETSEPDTSAISNVTSIGIGLSTNGGDSPMEDIVINNSKIYNFHAGVDVNGNLGNFKLINSEIFNMTNSAIMMYGLMNKINRSEILIENNDIHDQYQKFTGADLSHGSGIVVSGDNYTIRNNRIHSFGSSYAIGVYDHQISSLLMENNLIYDSYNEYRVQNIRATSIKQNGTNQVVIRNNTFVSFVLETPSTGRDRYGYATYAFGTSSASCSNLIMENNIFIGSVGFDDDCMDYTANNNLYYIAQNESSYSYQLAGSNTHVYDLGDSELFEQSFFDNSRFDRIYDHPTFENAPHREDLNDGFRPMDGSLACSGGIITYGHLVGESCAGIQLSPPMESSGNLFVRFIGWIKDLFF